MANQFVFVNFRPSQSSGSSRREDKDDKPAHRGHHGHRAHLVPVGPFCIPVNHHGNVVMVPVGHMPVGHMPVGHMPMGRFVPGFPFGAIPVRRG